MEWADGKTRCPWANPKNERYIRYHDEFGIDCPYLTRTITLKTQGPIEVIGPSSRPLKGGYCTFYVRSHKVDSKTPAKAILETFEGERTLDFLVE